MCGSSDGIACACVCVRAQSGHVSPATHTIEHEEMHLVSELHAEYIVICHSNASYGEDVGLRVVLTSSLIGVPVL